MTIAGNDGVQTFFLSFQGTEAFSAAALAPQFECTGSTQAAPITGVNTVDLTFSTTPVPDVIALAATTTNNGTVELTNGVGAFAVASYNNGANASITASVDTGSAVLPLVTSICQTNPSSGACLAAPAATVTLTDNANATPTFSIFLGSSGAIAFAPGSSRVFVRFKDSNGNLHGATSVAVETTN